MLRVHEAFALPCPRCGAALATDGMAPYAWCGACHAWQTVPDDVRLAAWQRARDVARNREAQAAELAVARRQTRSATWSRVQTGILTTLAIGGVLIFVLPLLATGALYVVASALVAFDELEPWAASLVVLIFGAAGLGFLAAFFGAVAFVYRRATRHRRWSRIRPADDWAQGAAAAGSAAVSVSCGECGAPIAFRAGEHALVCGHCRSVVLEPEEHAGGRAVLAFTELQRARRVRAKSDRDLMRARLAAARSSAVFRAWLWVGTIGLVAVPVLAVAYAVRALTPSLEEALLNTSKRLDGDFGSGLGPPFDWLDSHWLGATPPGFAQTGTFTSRWSVASGFQGRPFLLSVLASWTDLAAKEAALVLACPRERDATRVLATRAAQEIRARGFLVHVDYAGIALVAERVRQKQLEVDELTALARLAYELAEVR